MASSSGRGYRRLVAFYKAKCLLATHKLKLKQQRNRGEADQHRLAYLRSQYHGARRNLEPFL